MQKLKRLGENIKQNRKKHKNRNLPKVGGIGQRPYIYIYIYIHLCVYIHINIYIYIEREIYIYTHRERDMHAYVCIYIYIYIYGDDIASYTRTQLACSEIWALSPPPLKRNIS